MDQTETPRDILSRAAALHRAGEPADAERLCRLVLEASPNDPNALHLLGKLASQASRFGMAGAMLERAVDVDPGVPEFHASLAQLHARMGRPQKAQHAFRRALELRPNDLEMWIALAAMCMATGRHEEAGDAYQQALKLEPGHPAAVGGLALRHEQLGEIESAYQVLDPYLDKPSVDDRLVTVFATLCPALRMEKRGLELLEKAAACDTIPAPRREAVYFRLGELYARMADYDAAFAAYTRGHEARRTKWDPPKWTQMVDRVINTFTSEALVTLARSTCHDPTPVFIVGMPRSGSSLIEQTIACHPQSFGGGEMPDIIDMIVELHHELGGKRFFPRYVPDLTEDQLDRHAAMHMSRLRELSPDADRITDKNPGNFLNLGFIAQLFPQARVIHTVRDPLDTCVSIFTTRFTFGHQWTSDLSHIGAYYADYRRVMDHWRHVLDLPLLDVPYEDMVGDHEGTTRRILEFLGLPWDPACLAFDRSDRPVLTASYDQVRQPVYQSSVSRWKHYAKHLGPLRRTMAEGGAEMNGSGK